ncbi:MAG: DUF4062 domain-containing protein [Rhodobacteraceae bacterium]|nr:DUF4062 domain-containing protein [Paracoccaceae bacterium]
MLAQRTKPVKIFLASPSDVAEERETLASLVREVNDVLAFLAPDNPLRLELMRFETHVFPDIGHAQAVINRQIPQDYDIFIGVMWKRYGTPTSAAGSGTIEEFERALARREETNRPTIMFYFCDEPFAPPRGEDLAQFNKVAAFRDKMEQTGYILSYPERARFRDHVRSGLLRAVADIMRASEGEMLAAGPGGGLELNAREPNALEPDVQEPDASRSALPTEVERDGEMLALAAQYDDVRATMPSGGARTQKMRTIKAEMFARAAAAKEGLTAFKQATSAGERLAAISILQQFPALDGLEWLTERLDPEREAPFIGYSAAAALAQMVRSLPWNAAPATDVEKMRGGLNTALELAERNPADPPRINVLKRAIKEFEKRASR